MSSRGVSKSDFIAVAEGRALSFIRRDEIVAIVPAEDPKTSLIYLKNGTSGEGNALTAAETSDAIYARLVMRVEEGSA
jgi:hypothetical protein